MNAQPAARGELNRVALRTPPFWKDNPTLWFTQIESQFYTAGISQDETKYHMLVASVDTEVLTQVSDIVTDPPEANKYTALKERLIRNFTDSEERKLKKLLSEVTLGDLRPSQLLRKMQELAGNRMSAEVLKSLWLQRLPVQTQVILTTSTEEATTLAQMADKIAEVTRPDEIYQAQSPTQPTKEIGEQMALTQTLAALQQQVSKLSQQVTALSNNRRSRSSSRSRGTRYSTSSNRTTTDLCWYHQRFQEKARKCVPPCNFKNGVQRSEN